MKTRASLTAEYMALFRVIESARPAHSRLFCDPFAALFLRRWRKWVYGIARCDAGRRLVERLFDRGLPGARAAGIARTKWIDDEVTLALETSTQLVLLGAGFDTRAYRLPAAQRVNIFELDRAEMLFAKQAVLRREVGSLPRHVRFVSADLNTQPVADVLSRAGFDQTQSTCFVWEGVTNYLSPKAVDGTLRQIAQAAAGSILLFTYIDRRVLDHPELFFGAEKLLSRLHALGEPWTFGLYPEEIERYLAARKLQLVRDLSVAEVWRSAGRPGSDMRGYEFYRLASAGVPDAPPCEPRRAKRPPRNSNTTS
jgi:methyltransferase (TIGR00027 family)